MRARLRLVLASVAAAATIAASRTAAEPTGSYLVVAPHAGVTIFDGTLRYPTAALRDRLNLGGRLGWQWRPWLALEAAAGHTHTEEDLPRGHEVRFLHGSLALVVSPYPGRYGGPFLLAGGGASRLSSEGQADLDQGNWEIGGGLQFWLDDRFGARLEARDLMWFDSESVTDIVTHTVLVGGSLTYAIGARPRDTDADGVPDRRDRCPGTPAGARVDASGCPIDSDGDAVFDGLDQCADTPRGATVDARGCPGDADADSVLDGIDQCPDTPRGAIVDARGCPSDADGDGVADGLDKCPDTAAGLRVDKDGCPIEVVERETELLDTGMIRIQDVNFETAKATLMPDALPSLDVVGQVLAKWPDLRIEIGGHTDSRGSDAYNQRLSEARVRSVLEYLLQKFPTLKSEQYTVRGYGESRPLVPNTSPLNMAKNRRVEFRVLNTEVLKREIERRRLLREN